MKLKKFGLSHRTKKMQIRTIKINPNRLRKNCLKKESLTIIRLKRRLIMKKPNSSMAIIIDIMDIVWKDQIQDSGFLTPTGLKEKTFWTLVAMLERLPCPLLEIWRPKV